MIITPVTTRTLIPPKDDLLTVINELDLSLKEGSVVAVTAKVVAIHQGRSVLIPEDALEAATLKDGLIISEAETYLDRNLRVPFPRMFTIYEGTFCSSCGIDSSNSNGYFTLLPRDSSEFAEMLRAQLCEKYSITDLGIIITDSRSFPMRNGTVGVTIGYAGFNALYDYRDSADLFGRPFKAERINVADCLASASILAMGEGAEATPIVIMSDIPHIVFTQDLPSDDFMLSLKVPMELDVFTQFYCDQPWKQGGRYAI
jgi:F420-0:gamma-glutamyl ligase